MTQPEQLSDTQREQLLQCLMTEHTALQTARGSTIFDSNGRVTTFLSSLSSAIVALAFIGQVSELGNAFFVFALVLFPSIFFLGLVTFARATQSAIEDYLYARGINRIRHFYVDLAPPARDYFILPTSDDPAGALGSMGLKPSPFQLYLTTSGMVSVINAIIAGVFTGIVANQLGVGSLLACGVIGAVMFVATVLVQQRYQRRVWEQAERRAPVLFPSDTADA